MFLFPAIRVEKVIWHRILINRLVIQGRHETGLSMSLYVLRQYMPVVLI